MNRLLGLSAVVVVAFASMPASAFTWTDSFDTGINPSDWTQVNVTPITWDGTKDAAGSPTSGSAATTKAPLRMWHSLGTNAVPGYFKATWWVFDDTLTRAFGEIESRAGAIYSGALSQIFAAGKYNSVTKAGEVYNGSKYQGRVLYPSGVGGWFNLDGPGSPNRSGGWHKFDVERMADLTTVNFYVDDILSRTIAGANNADMNVLVLGFGSGSDSGNAWFDNAGVTDVVVPEPGSVLALGAGLIGFAGMILRKR